MNDYTLEGGPFDGKVIQTNGVHVLRMPLPMPVIAFVAGTSYSAPTIDYVEYEKSGPVYRSRDMIRDAWARMDISAEAFRDPRPRRYARLMLRERLQALGPDKSLGRTVYVVALDEPRSMFTVVAIVGGRRAEIAAYQRERLRLG